jgi:gluconokinase
VSLVVMGVSGCGKSTIGKLIATDLAATFIDGDDIHSEGNRVKMAGGIPLDDTDRLPWVRDIGMRLSEPFPRVIAASVLMRKYRDSIRLASPNVFFVYLAISPEVAANRVAARKGHFMPANLIESQFATLEPLEAGESGIEVNAELPFSEILGLIKNELDVLG